MKYAYARPGSCTLCYLVIAHDGEHFVGPLLFDDPEFGKKIAGLLQANIGRSLKEIGDFDL